jgi:hypothetical protein
VPSVEPQIVAPLEEESGDPAQAIHWIHIFMQRSGDDANDRRRLRRLHNILTEFPGNDRFSIVIEGKGQPIKMEFPNHTTQKCDDLMHKLARVVGEDNIQVFNRYE